MPEKTKIHLRSTSAVNSDRQPRSLQPNPTDRRQQTPSSDNRPNSSRSNQGRSQQSGASKERSGRSDHHQRSSNGPLVNEPIIPPISGNSRSRKVKEVKAKSNQTRRKTVDSQAAQPGNPNSRRRPDQPLPELPGNNSRHSSLMSQKSNNYEVLPRSGH